MTVRLSDAAVVVGRCEQCGARFERPALLALGQASVRYCGKKCSSAARLAAWEARLAQHGTLCVACGELAARMSYGLALCRPCQMLAYRSCWRKRRYGPEDELPRRHADGAPLYPYRCVLCGGTHLKSSPGDEVNPDLRYRYQQLAASLREAGFDIDQARGWTNRPDGKHEL